MSRTTGIKKFWGSYATEIILIFFAVAVSIGSTAYFMSLHVILFNGDGIPYLNTARRILDSLTPGFTQLGYVWLPLAHLLMLPFIWNNFLYYSGLAGIIISMVSFVGAALLIFKTAQLLSGNRIAGIIAFILFIANPNISYMQATPLTEMLYVFTLTGGIYYLLLWIKRRRLTYLIVSSLFLLASNLSRYDGWFLSIAIICGLVIYELYLNKNWVKTEATAIIFGLVVFFGPVLWIIWNFMIFGNPIYFAVGQYSAKAQQLDLRVHGGLPSYHNLVISLQTVFYSAQMVIGWSGLALGLIGCGYLIWDAIRTRQYYKILFFMLGLQIFYYVINIYTGNAVIFIPQLTPHKMFNIRYAITFVPFFIIAGGVVLSKVKWFAVAILTLVLIEYGLVAGHHSIIMLNESVNGYASQAASSSRIQAGQWLAGHYDRGLILADTFVNDSAAFYSKIPLNHWIDSSNTKLYIQAMHDPAATVDWVLLRNRDAISQAFTLGDMNADGFGIVYQGPDILIFKKGIPDQVTLLPVVNLIPEAVKPPAIIPAYTTHVVLKGENLWSIAQIYLGDGKLWTKLASDNKLQNPNVIHVDDVIVIYK